jgi:two-component system, chemotaxis family, protein-glutamate methylesterase/glutaminase
MAQSAQRDIVVIGASSGGLEALLEIVRRLPPDLPAALFIVTHVPSQGRSYLPEILSRSCPLPATHAEDQEKIEPGRIYVAPPDFHLLLRKDHVRIVRGPTENNHRPAIDPLFRTAARAFGPRVVGIVLSGSLDDGTAGLFAIKARGGITVVQDPADALFPDMPRNALAAVPVDYCLAKSAISQVIVELTQQRTDRGATMVQNSYGLDKEIELEAMNGETISDEDRPGSPSTYGCPDCGGVLWELHEDKLLRFRCRVGHAYSAEGLLGTQGESLDAALWSAFRTLQENAALARRLAARARANKHEQVAEKFATKSRVAEEQAALIRNLLLSAHIKEEAREEIPDEAPGEAQEP